MFVIKYKVTDCQLLTVIFTTLGHYLSVTPKFYTKVLHQTLIPAAELWCKTLSRIKTIWFYTELKL